MSEMQRPILHSTTADLKQHLDDLNAYATHLEAERERLRAEIATLRTEAIVRVIAENASLRTSQSALVEALEYLCKGVPDNADGLAWRQARELIASFKAGSVGKACVYACPRCGTEMELDPTAKPTAPSDPIREAEIRGAEWALEAVKALPVSECCEKNIPNWEAYEVKCVASLDAFAIVTAANKGGAL